jgi:CheY-like chemotaxis protein
VKKILFVDDEKNVLDGIRRMLHPQRSHWEMTFVVGGDAALQVCAEVAFDVVVSDLRMPGMDGAELLGKIRDRYPGAARIVLSGYSDAALTARAVPVAHRVLAKPCDPIQLRHTIDRVCALQDVLCTPALRELVGTLGELPSLSSTYMALENVLRRPDAPIADIARIIEQDVAMTAKVLQIVNSGFFGLSRIVPSLEFAVSYLGLETIRMLVLY